MGDPGDMLQAALRYAELGYPVFPCVPGGKAPLTPHGFQDATTDAGQIEAWWTSTRTRTSACRPRAFWSSTSTAPTIPGPATGASSRTCRACPVSLTPRGGRHYIFRQPAGKSWSSTASKIAPKVDTRANGGYIVLPPSVVGGKPYRWAEDLRLRPGRAARAARLARGAGRRRDGPVRPGASGPRRTATSRPRARPWRHRAPIRARMAT